MAASWPRVPTEFLPQMLEYPKLHTEKIETRLRHQSGHLETFWSYKCVETNPVAEGDDYEHAESSHYPTR
jgi:hypothetical protein